MEKIEIGKDYTIEELEKQGVREIGKFGNELIISDGTRCFLWDPSSHKITQFFNDNKRYATY